MRQETLTLFLIGPRGSGKSTVGSLVARSLNLPFYDTDDMVTAEAGRSIADIVDDEGWAAFRARESRALAEAVFRAGRHAPDEAPPAAAIQGAPDAADMTRRHGPTGTNGGVISTGGGIILAEANRVYMRAAGTVIHLSTPIDRLYARLKRRRDSRRRPSLTGASLLEEISQILEERELLYRQTAHHSIDAAPPPDAVARSIMRLSGAIHKEAS
ncbi:MAG: shikimate kinase II [Desulfovibrio sp.]|jgi:shikimate kinase|nr:shikimate kinase II [Desulfovibrio sp.]